MRRQLNKHKTVITQAFILEIKGDVGEIKRSVNAAEARETMREAREMTKEERELLASLTPPDASLFTGKPSCLPGTRESVLAKIHAWVHDTSTGSRFFLLHGKAGCGKSTVAASICSSLADRLAGSFFCKRDQVDRRNPVKLVWSLSFFIAHADPSFRGALLNELRKPDVFVNKDLVSQFGRLIAKPMEVARPVIAFGTHRRGD